MDNVGQWKYWCYVNPEEECTDVQDGWSFKACSNGRIVTLAV